MSSRLSTAVLGQLARVPFQGCRWRRLPSDDAKRLVLCLWMRSIPSCAALALIFRRVVRCTRAAASGHRGRCSRLRVATPLRVSGAWAVPPVNRSGSRQVSPMTLGCRGIRAERALIRGLRQGPGSPFPQGCCAERGRHSAGLRHGARSWVERMNSDANRASRWGSVRERTWWGRWRCVSYWSRGANSPAGMTESGGRGF